MVSTILRENEEAIFSERIIWALQLIDGGEGAAAKLLWASNLGLEPNTSRVIDFHGSEYERFVSKYNSAWLQATQTSICRDCKSQHVRQLLGFVISSSNIDDARKVQEAVTTVLEPVPGVYGLFGGTKDERKRMFGRGPPFLIFEILLQVQEQFEYHL